MPSLRDIKRAGRIALHQAMSVRALYIASAGANPLPVTVRVHTSFVAVGQVHGGPGYAAEVEAVTPKLIFYRPDLATLPNARPVRGAIVSVEPGEAYKMAASDASDDAFVTTNVTRLDDAEAVGLPVPATIT